MQASFSDGERIKLTCSISLLETGASPDLSVDSLLEGFVDYLKIEHRKDTKKYKQIEVLNYHGHENKHRSIINKN